MSSETRIWQNMREQNKYFVNRNFLKYGVTKDNSDYTKRNKGLWVLAPLLALVCVNAVVFAFSGGSLVATLPCFFGSLAIYILILRKFVFDEKNFKRLMAENATKSLMGINGSENNLLSIDENNEWFFQNDQNGLRSSFLVTFDYNSLLDLSTDASRTSVEEALVPFIKELHNNKFTFTKYDINIHQSISLGTLKEIQQTKLLEKGSWLQLVEQLQNETLSTLEQNSSDSYKIYYLINNNDFKKLPNLQRIIESTINTTLTTQNSIVRPRIANQEEIINFIINYYEISSFDPINIKRNVQHMDISRYFDFTGFFDVNNVNYQLDDFIDIENEKIQNGQLPFNEERLTRLERNEKAQKEKQAKANKAKSIEDQRKKISQLQAENKANNSNVHVGLFNEKLYDRQAVLKNQEAKKRSDAAAKNQAAKDENQRKKDEFKVLGNRGNLTFNDLINQEDNKHNDNEK